MRGLPILLLVLALIVIGIPLLLGGREVQEQQLEGARAQALSQRVRDGQSELESSEHRRVTATAGARQPERTALPGRPRSNQRTIRIQAQLLNDEVMPTAGLSVGLSTLADWRQLAPPRWTGTLEENGVVEFHIDRSFSQKVFTDRLCVAVIEPGFQRLVARLPRRKPGGVKLGVDGHVEVLQGVSVFVVARDSSGQPLCGSRLSGRQQGGAARTTRTDSDGGAWFHFAKPGVFEFCASRANIGATSSGPIAVQHDTSPVPVELVVDSPGRLRGIVKDVDGNPVGGFGLYAQHKDIEAGRTWRRGPSPSAWRTDGIDRLKGTTDAAGEFDLAGLRLGSWTIFADASEHQTDPDPITRTPVEADGSLLSLTISRPRLSVHVVGCKPLTRGSRFDSSNGPWPRRPRVYLDVSPKSAHLARALSLNQSNGKLMRENLDYDVVPGATYVLALFGGGHSPVTREIRVGKNHQRTEVTLEVRPRSAQGTLVCAPTDTGGTSLESGYAVQVTDSSSGRLVHEQRHKPSGVKLPAGEYRVEIRGVRSPQGIVGAPRPTLERGADIGSWSRLVVVRGGEITRIEPQLSAAARLRLTLWGEAIVQPANLSRPQARSSRPRQRRFQLMARGNVEVTLLSPSGASEDVWFFPPNQNDGRRARGMQPRSILNQTTLSQPVSPGRFCLLLSTPDGRSVQGDVLLRPGQTTEVTMLLPPVER